MFFLLWLGCMTGSLAVLPYLHALNIHPNIVSVFIQSTLLFGFVMLLSYWILPKTDLKPFSFSYSQIPVSLLTGALVGLFIVLFDRWIPSQLGGTHPVSWKGALASLYGAINEEVLLRLFLFTTVYCVLSMLKKNRLALLWITNLFVALLFGLGHLPAAFHLGATSSFDVFRVLLLNGIAGIAFGWLYWSRSLFAAMLAHFTADLIIHAL